MRITRAFMMGQAAAHAGARGAHGKAESLLQKVLDADGATSTEEAAATPSPHDRIQMLEQIVQNYDATVKEQATQLAAQATKIAERDDRIAALTSQLKEVIALNDSNPTPPPISEAQEALLWLERKACESFTGVSIDHLNGYRVLWHHRAGANFPSIMDALRDAMK